VPRAKPQYPPQFKAEAVQLVQSSGSSISKIAKDLGISGTSLRNWVKQAQIDQGEREGLTTEEREELRKLRRENKVLKQEKRDFLKKAAVDSTGERNSGGQCISWGAVSECLAGSAVEF
jgi:transposase